MTHTKKKPERMKFIPDLKPHVTQAVTKQFGYRMKDVAMAMKRWEDGEEAKGANEVIMFDTFQLIADDIRAKADTPDEGVKS